MHCLLLLFEDKSKVWLRKRSGGEIGNSCYSRDVPKVLVKLRLGSWTWPRRVEIVVAFCPGGFPWGLPLRQLCSE